MNLKELINSSAGISFNVSAEDLKSLIDLAVIKAKEEFESKERETYLTAERAGEMLGVNRTTLWRWAKDNYLNPIEVGGKRRYRLSDVNHILEGR